MDGNCSSELLFDENSRQLLEKSPINDGDSVIHHLQVQVQQLYCPIANKIANHSDNLWKHLQVNHPELSWQLDLWLTLTSVQLTKPVSMFSPPLFRKGVQNVTEAIERPHRWSTHPLPESWS